MAGSLTDLAEIDILKLATGQATSIWSTTPYVPYIGLFTVAPTDSAAGTECTGGGYARVSTAGLWGTPASGQVANSSAIALAAFTGTVSGAAPFVAFGLFTAITAGTLVIYGDLTDPTKVFGASDTAAFPIGALILTAT